MIDIAKLVFSLLMVAGSDSVLITEITSIKEFIDKKPTDKILGFSYTVVAPQNKFTEFKIKVEQAAPVITPEELEAKGGTVKAKIKGFEGHFYKDRNGIYQFTSKATAIEVIV